MEFTQQSANQNTVISIDESTITLSHTQLKIPCFVSSKKVEEISISSLEEISKEATIPLVESRITRFADNWHRKTFKISLP